MFLKMLIKSTKELHAIVLKLVKPKLLQLPRVFIYRKILITLH